MYKNGKVFSNVIIIEYFFYEMYNCSITYGYQKNVCYIIN